MKTINSESAPVAAGPYSHAVMSDGLVFCSGQLGLDPATGTLASGGAAAQTHRAMANLEEVLKTAGCGLCDVVKTTIFIVDMTLFAEVNTAYGQALNDHRPARSTVGVSALPLGALVEIECVAVGLKPPA